MALSLYIFLALGFVLLICLPALLVGLAMGKKAAAIVAVSCAVPALIIVGIPLILFPFTVEKPTEAPVQAPAQPSVPGVAPGVDVAMAELPADPTVRAFAARLAEQQIVSDPAAKPAWVDQAPGRDQAVYRLPVKSGLYSTQEECRHALAAAIALAVVHYGKNYLPDFDAPESDVLHHLPADLGAIVIEKPLYGETVSSSVGPMQQLYALVEFNDDARAQLREAWRQAAIPRRLRWALSGFACALGIVAVLWGSLRFDLASGGKHRGRLQWATALLILLVVGGACGICLL